MTSSPKGTDVVNVTPPSVCRVEYKVVARAWGPTIDLAEMELEWGRLEQILRKRPNFQEVVFKVETESFSEEFRGFVAGALPYIQKKSLLQCN